MFNYLQNEKQEVISAEKSRGDNLLKKVAHLDRQLTEERQLRYVMFCRITCRSASGEEN